ncbi:MAG: FAD-binding oxidoreductase [Patescibacteria group bacterium]
MSEANPLPSGGHIIIGGGATGALCAVKLAEAGFKVTVLEQALVGNGSSSRSAACIRAQFGVPETVLGMVYSEQWYTDIHEHLHTPADQREQVLVANGYLFLWEDPESVELWNRKGRRVTEETMRQVRSNVDMQQALGLPVELLGVNEVQARWPHLNGEQMWRIGAATWCPTDGFLKHDLIYMLGFRRARELGVTVLENAEVVSAKLEGGRIRGVYLADGRLVEGDVVINCTNAWGPRLSRALGGMELPIKPIKRYLAFTPKPVNVDPEGWRKLPMTIYGMGPGRVAYSRPDAGSLMTGWAHDADPDPNFTSEDQDRIEAGFNGKVEPPYSHLMINQVREFAPSLVPPTNEGISMTCGYYGDTPDHSPLIGWDEQVDGLMHACGFSGHGLMHAPITARLVTELVKGQRGEVQLNGRINAPLKLGSFAPARDFSHVESHVL